MLIGVGDHGRVGERWKKWTRYAYLSDFEKRLNRSLWWLLLIALAYSLAQHVLLANVPEVFRGGARIGDLLYDFAIAYVGAFIFYLLVVRVPLRRDRRTIYRHLAELIGHAVGEARNFIGALNLSAGFDDSRETPQHPRDASEDRPTLIRSSNASVIKRRR